MGGPDPLDEELPDASTLGEPPPLSEVLDDLAMRFVVNCPPEEQESFERLLFQVEAAFWFYEDQYREIWPRSFPVLNLLTFSEQLFKSCPLLKPFQKRTKEIYEAFTTYKRQIPTCGAMLLNEDRTKLLLVKSYNGKAWGFPKGKIDKDEDKVDCAVREVFEEVGYDMSEKVDANIYIETQWQQQTIRLYIVPGVPDDTAFRTRTKKEIGDITWHKIKEIPTTKDDAKDAKSKFWMVQPFIVKLLRHLAIEKQEAKKKGKGKAKQQQPAGGAPSAEPAKGASSSSAKAAAAASSAPSAAAASVPLGVKPSKKDKKAAAAAAEAAAAAAPANVQVLQRVSPDAAARPQRQLKGHPFLDFAFDRQALVQALKG